MNLRWDGAIGLCGFFAPSSEHYRQLTQDSAAVTCERCIEKLALRTMLRILNRRPMTAG